MAMSPDLDFLGSPSGRSIQPRQDTLLWKSLEGPNLLCADGRGYFVASVVRCFGRDRESARERGGPFQLDRIRAELSGHCTAFNSTHRRAVG